MKTGSLVLNRKDLAALDLTNPKKVSKTVERLMACPDDACCERDMIEDEPVMPFVTDYDTSFPM